MSSAASQLPRPTGLDSADYYPDSDSAPGLVPYLVVRKFSDAGQETVDRFLRHHLRKGVPRETALRQILGSLEESLNQGETKCLTFALTDGNTHHGRAAVLTVTLDDLVVQGVLPGVCDE